MYRREIDALKRASRFRERRQYDPDLLDFASNDYLGMAHNKTTLQAAYGRVMESNSYAPKASMLVNGYAKCHALFEEELARANGFERGVLLGSGFLANLALIESLVRKKDVLLIDEMYHASGVMATQNAQGEVITFGHNDVENLEKHLDENRGKRILVAIEGVYSMEGDIAPGEIHDLCRRYGAMLLVDEAHSSGTIGEELLGWFDHHGISPDAHCIKMGTLGKAYGSYGAYILGSAEIISFLENRAKPLIYSTALSLFDTMHAHENFRWIQTHTHSLREEIQKRQQMVREVLGQNIDSLILKIPLVDSDQCLRDHENLMQKGYLVGAIRPPTVSRAILRVILRTVNSLEETHQLLQAVKPDA